MSNGNPEQERAQAAFNSARDNNSKIVTKEMKEHAAAEVALAVAAERKKAIAWIRKNCQVDTGDGIYGDASKYTAKQITKAIHERGRR